MAVDEDMDAEGEMVAEHEHEQEIVVRQDVSLAVQPEIAQLSPVSLSSFVGMDPRPIAFYRRMLATLNKW